MAEFFDDKSSKRVARAVQHIERTYRNPRARRARWHRIHDDRMRRAKLMEPLYACAIAAAELLKDTTRADDEEEQDLCSCEVEREITVADVIGAIDNCVAASTDETGEAYLPADTQILIWLRRLKPESWWFIQAGKPCDESSASSVDSSISSVSSVESSVSSVSSIESSVSSVSSVEESSVSSVSSVEESSVSSVSEVSSVESSVSSISSVSEVSVSESSGECITCFNDVCVDDIPTADSMEEGEDKFLIMKADGCMYWIAASDCETSS